MIFKTGGYLFFAAITATVMLLGCGDDSPTGQPVTRESITGRWNLNSAQLIGTASLVLPDPLPDTTYEIDSSRSFTGNDDFAQFDSSMTYRLQINEIGMGMLAAGAGTWSVDGNRLTLIPQSGVDTTVLYVSVSGNSGTFVQTPDSIQVSVLKLPFSGSLIYYATRQ